MRRYKYILLVVLLVILVSAVIVPVVLAHNAGHIHLASGECVNVGSGKHAHNPDMQDRSPTPGDQYGARWAAEQGNTPIWPRHCHEAGAHNHP